MNLNALGAFASAIPGGMQQAQEKALQLRQQAQIIQQNQLKLDEQKHAIAADALALQGLTQQQAPMPGQASQPAQQPQPGVGQPAAPQQQQPRPMGTLGQPGASGGAAAAPAQPAAGAQPTGGREFAGPAGGIEAQSPLAVIQRLAQQVKQANPNADPTTTLMAVDRVVGMMRNVSPDYRAEMQANIRMMQMDNQFTVALMKEQDSSARLQMTADHYKEMYELSKERIGATERGQDIASRDRALAREERETRTKFVQDKIDQRAAQRRGDKQDTQTKAAAYKSLMARRMEITDKISAYQSMGPSSGVSDKEYQQLVQKRAATDRQLIDFWTSNSWLPRPSELVNSAPQDSGGAPGGTATAGGASPPAGGEEPPYPANTEGQIATSPNGEKWITKGSRWVKMLQ